MKTKALFFIFCIAMSLSLAVCWLLDDRFDIALAAPAACVAGPHSGPITSNQEWCVVDNPHYVTGSVTVNAGVTLTIYPGVIVYFNPGTSLSVNGTLIATGTPEQSIVFTSPAGTPAPGDWGTINAGGGSTLSMAYCDVGYGGGAAGNRGIYIVTSNVEINTCRIHHVSGDGVRIEGAGLNPVFESVEIDHNISWPIHQSAISQGPTYVNLSFHDNGTDALLIDHSDVGQDITLDGSPSALNGAPIYYGGGAISAPYTLAITPGTTVKMGNSSLSIAGGATLIAEGTSGLPITFTSQAADPQPGDWGSINVNGDSHLSMMYCDIGYAGNSAGNRIFYIVSDDVQIRHSHIHHSQGVGVTIDHESSMPVFEDVEFDHNASWPILQEAISTNPTYIDLYFHDNGTDALNIGWSNVGLSMTLDGSPDALNGAPIYYGGGSIGAGYTLTVTPGTTVKMGNSSLSIAGGATLIAEGIPELPITFTSQAADPQPGDWGSINVNGDSHLSMMYCDIGYAGNGAGNRIFYIVSDDAQIRHSRIHHSQGVGMTIDQASSMPVFEDVEFDHNASWPILQGIISSNPTYIDLYFHDNGTDALNIGWSNVGLNMTLDGSPSALNGAPIYYGGGAISAPYTLAITPGTTIKMGNSSLSIAGGATLIAEGTSGLPITFTSQAADPQPGDWGSINVNGDSHLSMMYCDIGYAGNSAGNRIFYIVSDDVQIRHSHIHHSQGVGVTIDHESSMPVFEDVEFDHNASWPILQEAISTNPTYIDLYFHDNGTDALNIGWSNVGLSMTLDGSPDALNGAPIYYGGGSIEAGDTLTVTAGTMIKMAVSGILNVNGTLIADGTPWLPITFTSQADNPQPGDWLQIHANSGSTMRLAYCKVSYSGSGGGTRAVWLSSSSVELHHCLIDHSLGDAIFIDNNSQILLQNMAIINSGWSGLSIMPGSSIEGLHLSLAFNGSGSYVASTGSLNLTNTILSQNTVGINVVNGGSATLTQTLWDRNETDVIGTINETGHIDGTAGFDLDGYHITRYSAGLQQGVDVGVSDDIDGDVRPLPEGTPPDLGADEFPYILGEDFAAEKIAFEPQWVVVFDPESGEGYGLIRQRYMLRYYYGSPEPNPPDLTVSISDTLPNQLDFEYEAHNPDMGFTQTGQDLFWETSSPVGVGQMGEILLSSLFLEPEPGLTLVNQAAISAGNFYFGLQATTQVPLFPPLITTPGNGEICPDPTGTVQLQGTAQAGSIIHIYENGVDVATTTPGIDGTFIVSYLSEHVGIDLTTTVTAQACAPSNPDYCSDFSQPVILTQSQSFWCPQRSTWSDVVYNMPVMFRFRDASGWFSTQDWVISGMYGFSDSDLTMYACNCPAWTGTTDPPTSLWVVADGVTYYPSGSYPWYTFDITGEAHNVEFWAKCGSNNISDQGVILVDPDGYVFDVSEGFDPENPAMHAMAGVTVTAYVSMTEWGGWVPWPAQLYNNQVNPQVTGEDGYFAFFTPPGQYYLQVDSIEGYQPWRSPVIDVIAQIVHVNVPYTHWTELIISNILLTDDGPNPAEVIIMQGEAIEWCVPLDGLLPPEELILLYNNPVMQPLSDIGPINYTSAWDGGMMTPGHCYRRQFDQPGTFTYTDSLGHSGVIIVKVGEVETFNLFLPTVVKNTGK